LPMSVFYRDACPGIFTVGRKDYWFEKNRFINYRQAQAPVPSTMAFYAESNSHYSSFKISVRCA
jgi:hypothetical protein